METFIVSITAKPGHEDSVATFYLETEEMLKAAPGYQGRKIYQAKVGEHVAAVRRHYTAEELAKHPEPPHGHPGTDFIIIEFWDSADARMDFSKNVMGGKNKELFPHLEPSHSHEFFEEITGG
jgi:heme-degrading monooxygenase HmoA